MIRVTRKPEILAIEISGDDLSYLQGISSVADEVAEVVYGGQYMNAFREPAAATLRALHTALVAAQKEKPRAESV